MEGLLGDLRELRAGFLDMKARATEEERRAGADRRWADQQVAIVDRAIVEAEALMGRGAETVSSNEVHAVVGPVLGEAGGRRRFQRRPILGGEIEVPYFIEPDHDDVTGEPVYDVHVVRGKKNNRQRVMAAARVYGPKLREVSLANVIYETGETKAGSPASVRSSLGGLVRYGGDWERENGWLHFMGEELSQNRDMMRMLINERLAKRQQAN